MFKPLYDKVMVWNSQDLIGALNSLFPSQFKKKKERVCRKAAMKIPLVKSYPDAKPEPSGHEDAALTALLFLFYINFLAIIFYISTP